MKTLIVEDDFTCRLLLQELLKAYGPSHVAVTGSEAVAAVRHSLDEKAPYDLVCMDIMMPGMDGQTALAEIRKLEAHHGLDAGRGARVLMTSALHDGPNVVKAFKAQCDGYLLKPVEKSKLLQSLRDLKLMT